MFRRALRRASSSSVRTYSSINNGRRSLRGAKEELEEIPKLTTANAVGGMAMAAIGGLAVFCAGSAGVIGASSLAAHASRQYIQKTNGETKKTTTRREELVLQLEQVREEKKENTSSWAQRRKEKAIKRELKRLVDEM